MRTLLRTLFQRASAIFFLLSIGCIFLTGCVVADGGYGYGYDYGGSMNYYEPYGAYYGGWGPGYQIGPYRHGGDRGHYGGDRPGTRPFRPAPSSHPMPSIPGRPRSGNARHK